MDCQPAHLLKWCMLVMSCQKLARTTTTWIANQPTCFKWCMLVMSCQKLARTTNAWIANQPTCFKWCMLVKSCQKLVGTTNAYHHFNQMLRYLPRHCPLASCKQCACFTLRSWFSPHGVNRAHQVLHQAMSSANAKLCYPSLI
jgi:hypothetical protein